jgi:protein-disulfide isomerase
MSNASKRNADKRAEILAAQKKNDAQDRIRRSLIFLSIIILALSLAGLITYILAQEAPEERAGPTTKEIPASIAEVGAISVSEGKIIQEIPDEATVVDIYLDYLCPYCGMFETTNEDVLDELSDTENVVLNYYPISILDRQSQGSRYSTRSANASVTVAEKSPENWLAFHTALFENQPQEGGTGLSTPQLEKLAQDAGVPQDVSATFVDEKYSLWVKDITEEAMTGRVEGTPSVFINDQQFTDTMNSDALLEAVLAAGPQNAAN